MHILCCPLYPGEFSRPVKSIMDEAKRLMASGTVELSLLGQNVNAWHGEAETGLYGILAVCFTHWQNLMDLNACVIRRPIPLICMTPFLKRMRRFITDAIFTPACSVGLKRYWRPDRRHDRDTISGLSNACVTAVLIWH